MASPERKLKRAAAANLKATAAKSEAARADALAAGQARRSQACAAAIVAVLKKYNCQTLIAQKTADGQAHILTGIPLQIIYLPAEAVPALTGQAPPASPPLVQPPGSGSSKAHG